MPQQQRPQARLLTPEPARHDSPTATASRLTHLIFERTDLDEAQRFLHDFGLLTVQRREQSIYLKGRDASAYCYELRQGPTNRFVGLGLAVPRREDLLALAQLEGAGAIQPSDRPGGGEVLALTDPAGFRVEILFGQALSDTPPHRPPLPINGPDGVTRVNAFQRPPMTPPEVLKLGHVVIEVADFQRSCGWYTRHLGFIPSDVQVLPDGAPAVVFLRLNCGDEPTDHHTLAIAQGFMATYSHSAYEVVDTDAVAMGQRVLRERGWRHAWGMGRHILGSQIFDYWQDSCGAKHEHYCDGDLLTARMRTGIHPVSRDAMSQWGPPMPSSFTRPALSLSALAALFRNLRRSPDLTFKRLLTLARLFG
jgi:catechol 2,3-dioxygenase-like lactoylglutathione lyase family enzyme